jgi:hypothetical protein
MLYRHALIFNVAELFQGTTDSEMTFALFMNMIPDPMGDYSPAELMQAVSSLGYFCTHF